MVEGKLRKLSQCSDAFLAVLGTVVDKITTTTFTVEERALASSFGASIVTQPSTGNNYGSTVLAPSGTQTESDLNLINAADPANAGYLDMGIAVPNGYITMGKFGTGSVLPFHVTIGSNNWVFGTTGILTLPSMLKNTAIADPAAAAGQLWLSSTNVDNIKYSSGTTLYTVHSTKGAVATNTAAAPTATASATAVMMACGGAITPLNTGRVHITISGQLANDTINDGATVDLRYGTGTAPINGAAVTGTLVGIAQTQTSLVGAAKSGFCISGVVTGLTLGTAIWIDASLLRVTGGNASITGVTISAFEV